MAKGATSVYIDDSSIRVLSAKGKRVRRWASASLEPGLVKHGVILNQDAVAAEVRRLWRDQKIGAGKVVAGISGINCLYRWLTLPELPDNLLGEAVQREAGRVLGVPLEQLYTFWQVLPSLKGEMSIYLAAAPRNCVDALISTLRKAGLNPYLMDLRTMALARSSTEPSAIIIDLQPASFDIVVKVNGIPEVMRSVPLPGEALLEEKMSSIREELDRAITFYNSSHVNSPIGPAVPLFASGELAGREDSWKLIAGRREDPVQALPSSMEAGESFPAWQYATNIGLVLKEVAGRDAIAYSRINFNALPEAYRPKRTPLSELLYLPVLIVGIALVAYMAYLSINALSLTSALRAEWAGISQLAVSRQAEAQAQAWTQTTEIKALEEQVSLREQTAAAFSTTFGQFAANRDEINGDLGQINKVPGTIDLLDVTGNTKAMTVTGRSAGEDALFHYARELRASGRFASVVITDMHQEEVQLGFTLTLTR
jgi:type IV pilus assembly protein PilM